MAGSVVEDYGTGGSSSCIEGMSNEQRCQSADSLAEWRSCEQVENGTPSTSPPYWDTDYEDDDSGAKPADLYGKFTWKIEKFSEINKRELRSNAFEVGGYKWYILIYPQGCEVTNHLSLFLCVANHDKLLPGWSHFAQFTIAVVNKDPKKSKYSDTLHRFWKKEHDWGWKKFMELSKVADGFIVADTLVIKAQVQVIREKAHRPFRCLDRHYRRELVRVYLSNVESICRSFVEERRGKLSKLIEDKMRWSSFRAFWLGIDKASRRRMSRDKTDMILKVAVKQFFVEKEVTSTLVMDSLYSGLKALESQSGVARLVDIVDLPDPMVLVDQDMFVLADDVLLLLERVVELLPHQPSHPKDDKGIQNRTKDGNSGEELIKDSIERDERRLTELGRRTVEIFVIAHIFSRIEVAYKEAVALKRQEELIREEEVAGQVENELKAKRGAVEKEKRAKKKQAKQKRNARKGKDRGRDEKSEVVIQDKLQPATPSDRRLLEDFSSRQADLAIEKIDTREEASERSDAGGNVPEALQPELDDRDTSSINWDTDTSEIHPAVEASGIERQNGNNMEKGGPSIIDDSCSTCSTDSVPSIVTNGPYKGNSSAYNKSQMSPARVKNQRSRDTHNQASLVHGGNTNTGDSTTDSTQLCDDTESCRDLRPEPEPTLCSKDSIQRTEQHLVEKEEATTVQKKVNAKEPVEAERPCKSRAADSPPSPPSPAKKAPFDLPQPNQSSENSPSTPSTIRVLPSRDPPSFSPAQTEKSTPLAPKPLQPPPTLKPEAQKLPTPSKNTTTHQVPPMSRPLSAPLVPSPRPPVPIASSVPTPPLLSRSVSSIGRLGTDPSPSAPCYVPQSYRNAIMGKASVADFTPLTSSPSSSQTVIYSQSPSTILSSGSMLPPQPSAKNGPSSVRPGFTFGSVKWRDVHSSHQEASTSNDLYGHNLESDISRLSIHGKPRAMQSSGEVSDEFPHLAIINDLLDDDQSYYHPSLNRQYTFPLDTEQYYREGFQRVYGHGALHGLMELSGYANGRIEAPIQNEWPYLGGVDANGYSYQLQEYLSSPCAENGYNLYRPGL